MNPQQAKELLESPIFKAFAEGKTIQIKYPASEWETVTELSDENFTATVKFKLRIKPEPRVYWGIECNGILHYVSTDKSEVEKAKAKVYVESKFVLLQLIEVI
jgi:hypothetical protein